MKYPTPNTRDIKTPRDLAYAFRQGPYAWPGGYPTMLVLTDGACLCHACTGDNYRYIASDLKSPGSNSGWCPAGVDVNWEDSDLYCAHCNDKIESAYGEDTP